MSMTTIVVVYAFCVAVLGAIAYGLFFASTRGNP
jgi:hypothetical protein